MFIFIMQILHTPVALFPQFSYFTVFLFCYIPNYEMMMNTLKKYLNDAGQILLNSVKGFMYDNALKMAASLSYYTLFSIAPMLIIIIALGSFFFGQDAIKGRVYAQINDFVGDVAAAQIQNMIENVHLSGDSYFATTIAILTFFFGATSVFAEIQDSVNRIWSLRVKPERGLQNFIFTRLISFSMVVTIGFLLLVSLIINTALSLLIKPLEQWIGGYTTFLLVVNFLIVFCSITTFFAIIFKVLPDAELTWRDTWIGAVFTAILFIGGEWLVGIYLSSSASLSIYGAAGSVVVILLWVYYSSIILFFGAEFTKAFVTQYNSHLKPTKYAFFVVEKEFIHKSLPETTETVPQTEKGKPVK